jgi:hypothetical protein
MHLKYTTHYKSLTLADTSCAILAEESQKIENITPGSYSVFKTENQMILKVVKNGVTQTDDVIYKYSNKGNISTVIYTDKRGFRIKKIYDFTKGYKELIKIKFFKDHDFVKCEKYKNNALSEIIYYKDNVKFCAEFFSKDVHPDRVEYYNNAGLKV